MMTAASIESIAMPRGDVRKLYRFEDLEVDGPAIVVTADKRNSLQACAWRASRKLGRTFKVKLFKAKGGKLVLQVAAVAGKHGHHALLFGLLPLLRANRGQGHQSGSS